jgi:hypothetical protein
MSRFCQIEAKSLPAPVWSLQMLLPIVFSQTPLGCDVQGLFMLDVTCTEILFGLLIPLERKS